VDECASCALRRFFKLLRLKMNLLAQTGLHRWRLLWQRLKIDLWFFWRWLILRCG
jgi:hypothetical protein